jgi:hypothetical protein
LRFTEQLAKLATPETVVTLGHVKTAPFEFTRLKVTETPLVVTTLLEPSSKVTTGCVVSAIPPVELPGCVVKTSWEAGGDALDLSGAMSNTAVRATTTPTTAYRRSASTCTSLILRP